MIKFIGYQPSKDNLDPKNPPKGGSGVSEARNEWKLRGVVK